MHTVRFALKEMSAEHGFDLEGLSPSEVNPKRIAYLNRSAALLAIVQPLRSRDLSYERIAAELNRQGVPTPKNGKWHGARVRMLLLLAPVIEAHGALLGRAA